MVTIDTKTVTKRTATARSRLVLPASVTTQFVQHMAASSAPSAAAAVHNWNVKKGPVFATAVIAATMSVKNTPGQIPFCHPLPIEGCKVDCDVSTACDELVFTVTVTTTYKTGVEMEALVGASTAALTAYDMLKGIEGAQPGMYIADTRLIEKRGGKSDVVPR